MASTGAPFVPKEWRDQLPKLPELANFQAGAITPWRRFRNFTKGWGSFGDDLAVTCGHFLYVK